MPRDFVILNKKYLGAELGECKINIEGESHDEYIRDIKDYSELCSIENWRNIFLDDYSSSFFLSDKMWKNSEECFSFVKDWVNTVSKDEGKYEDEELDIRALTKNDYSYVIDVAIKLVLFAKFSQNHKLRKILLATKNADLCYITYDKEKDKLELVPWRNLMLVRSCIKLFDGKIDLSAESQLSRSMIIEVVNNAILKHYRKKQEPLSFKSKPLSFLNLI